MSRPLFWILLSAEGILSVLTAVLYGLDKRYAVKKKRRIRERTLLLFTWLFGAPGALVGLSVFRHKTQKPRFVFSAAAGFFLQAALLIAVFFLGW